MSYDPSPEFAGLLEVLVEGCLTEQEKALLTEILRNDAEARTFFVEYMSLHATLQWEAIELFQMDKAGGIAHRVSGEKSCDMANLDVDKASLPAVKTAWHRGAVWALASMALASCFLFAFVYWSGESGSGERRVIHSSEIRRKNTNQNSFVGILSATHNAQWSPTMANLTQGNFIVAGDFTLVSGKVSIDLFEGGRIFASGPAHFNVSSDQSLVIASGKVRVSIEDEHARLKVETPAAELIHIGTEFIVEVWPDGTSDLAVLDGAVEVYPRLQDTVSTSAQYVHAGNEFRIMPNGKYGTYPEKFASLDEDSLQDLNPMDAEFSTPAISSEGFNVRYVKVDPDENVALLELSLADRLLNGEFIASEDVFTERVPLIDFEERGHTKNSENLFSQDLPFPGDRGGQVDLDDGFAIHASGWIEISQTWIYSFLTNADDGVRLRIDGQDVIIDDGFHSPTISIGSIPLTRGKHHIELVYYDMHRGARLELGVASGKRRDSSSFIPLRISSPLE
ncbi:FecR protein [Bremerella volcania]|uniref:FecR protein n=1 Tax=Bremerella volcania TaxID=2527984 RepID=A0A518CC48_9BACT|nr:PA14 domain-containing protein [Bremerella volcania]QDU76802.1 FecR protein [Bremerella volcania]